MKTHKLILVLLIINSSLGFAQKIPSKSNLINIIETANNFWQSTHPIPGNSFWDNAAYHTGNMEAYFVTGNEAYRKYSEVWAEKINGKVLNPTTKPIGNTPTENLPITFYSVTGKFVFKLILICTTLLPTAIK